MWHWSLCVLFVSVGGVAFNNDDQLQSDEIIEAVNAAETTWKAGRNFHPLLKKKYLKNLFGTLKKPISDRMQSIEDLEDYDSDDIEFSDLPKDFDAREKWPFCKSLQEVRDQGSCGSCWAVSTAAAFTDRLCIATNGSFNGHLSAQQLLTCCFECGDGCKGGTPAAAWLYFQEHGVVSGGDFESKEGCQPYTFPECEHYVSGPRSKCRDDYDFLPTPECRQQCYNNEYKNISFEDDLHTVKLAYSISSSEFDPDINELILRTIQKEIYKNGPVTTTFGVYEDFLAYKSGVYQYTTGEYVYGHAVKIIGWGEEEGTPFWLVANSWNTDWGEKGFFKIKRGSNECGFEEEFHGGVPNV